MSEKKIIKVDWEDSATYREWYDEEEIKKLIEETPLIQSIGYLVKENEIAIAIASNNDGDKFSATTIIPKKCIKGIKYVKED